MKKLSNLLILLLLLIVIPTFGGKAARQYIGFRWSYFFLTLAILGLIARIVWVAVKG